MRLAILIGTLLACGLASACDQYFEALGLIRAEVESIAPGQRRAHVEVAYRKAASNTHPDVNPDNPKAGEQFKKVREAYEALKDQMPPASTTETVNPRVWSIDPSTYRARGDRAEFELMVAKLEEEFAERMARSRAKTLPGGQARNGDKTFLEAFLATLLEADSGLPREQVFFDELWGDRLGSAVGFGERVGFPVLRGERFTHWAFFEGELAFIERYWDRFWSAGPTFEHLQKMRAVLDTYVSGKGFPFGLLRPRFLDQTLNEVERLRSKPEAEVLAQAVKFLTLAGRNNSEFHSELFQRLSDFQFAEGRDARWVYQAKLSYLFVTQSRYWPDTDVLMELNPFRTLLQLAKWKNMQHKDAPEDVLDLEYGSGVNAHFAHAFWGGLDSIHDGDFLLKVWNHPVLRAEIQKGRENREGSHEFFTFLDEALEAAHLRGLP